MDPNAAMVSDTSLQPQQRDVTENRDILNDILYILENNGTGTLETPNMTDIQPMASPGSISSSSASSSPTYTSLSQRSPQSSTIEGNPFIRIVEQPHPKGLRFRYICEGRSAGSIPGINSTPENKTYPTIEIVGYTGNVKIVVSCVTADEPYRPHPHNLVGKDGCDKGVCTMRINGAPMRAVFSNLGIQCVKKKDIKAALEEREKIKVDPFKTKFAHKDQPTTIDLNIVRLCFQAFIQTRPGQYYKLKPVVTEPIYDKKSINDLVICRLCSCSAKASGGDTIFLLCEKLPKDDIKIRFYEEKDNEVIWQDYGEFQQTDIHKQTAIAFKTPRYHNPDIDKRTQVFIQLVRFSNDAPVPGQEATFSQVSDPLPFEFYPDPGMRSFPRLQRKLKRRQDMEIFQQILSLDSETTATKYSEISLNDEDDNDLDNDTDETVTTASSSNQAQSSGTLNENDEIKKRHKSTEEDDEKNDGDDNDDIENIDDYTPQEGRKSANMDIEFPVPQLNLRSIDDCTQTSTPMEEILRNTELGTMRQLGAVDKITEWMKSNEFERTDSLTVETGDTVVTCVKLVTDDDMNTELIEQDIEYENQPDLELLTSHYYDRQNEVQGESDIPDEPDICDIPVPVRDFDTATNVQVSDDVDDHFDDSATYTSLQIAFENPIDIPEPYPNSAKKEIKDKRKQEYNFNPFTNHPAPEIHVSAAQPPQTPPSPPLPLPPRTPSPVPEQMLPPLPPKRKPSQELEIVFTPSEPTPSREVCDGSTLVDEGYTKQCTSSVVSDITITNTEEESPTKLSITPSPSPCKKQGFFSRFFSRRKSKPDPTSSTPNESREPSVSNFSLNDTSRSSVRSIRSLQPNVEDAHGSAKSGKPVGRSVSSVSGKSPAYREGDIIHIPLKGPIPGRQSDTVSHSCILDQRSISALQLANVPLTDGNMELLAIADREGIKRLSEDQFKRKRGNHMRIIRELQQSEQMHNNSNRNNNAINVSNTMWNIPPASSSPSVATFPEIKNEPFLSPNNCNAYRSSYQMSPSPQPLSPMNRNSTTPSPGLMKTSSGESQSQMCSAFNQIQMTYNYNTPNISINNSTNTNTNGHNNNPFLDGRSDFHNTNQLHATTTNKTATSPSNPFFNPTSGGSITPLYPNDINVNLSNTSHFHAFNIVNNGNHCPGAAVAAASTLNIVDNQFQYHQYHHQQQQQQQSYQQQQQMPAQQMEDTNEATATLNALLQIDSANFINVNSDELPLSNMSISA